MSGTCKDCRFWRPYSEFEGVRLGLCALTDEDDPASRSLFDVKFWALPDAGASSGAIGTTEDFGCNQFEAKD